MTETGRATGQRLTDEQRIDWLRLIRSESVGPLTFRSLVNRFGGASNALDALPGLLAERGKTIRIPARGEIEREIERAKEELQTTEAFIGTLRKRIEGLPQYAGIAAAMAEQWGAKQLEFA